MLDYEGVIRMICIIIEGKIAMFSNFGIRES